MELWQQSKEQVGRRRIGSPRWRRRRLCGWCGRCAPSWALITARSGESLTSWGSVWSRCASGSAGPATGSGPDTAGPAAAAPASSPPDTSIIEVLRRPVESGQFTSLRWGERLAELGAVASVGSVGDSYDNTQRLHSHLGDTPPAEFEEAYAARQAARTSGDPNTAPRPGRDFAARYAKRPFCRLARRNCLGYAHPCQRAVSLCVNRP